MKEKQNRPKRMPRFTKSERMSIRASLYDFDVQAPDAGKAVPVSRNIVLLACCDLGSKPSQEHPADDVQMKTLFNSLICDIESGADLSNRIIKLGVSADDWRKLVAAKTRQSKLPNGSTLPLKVGIRVVRD